MIKWRPNGVNFCKTKLLYSIIGSSVEMLIIQCLSDDTFKDNLARDIADKRENQVDQVSKDGR